MEGTNELEKHETPAERVKRLEWELREAIEELKDDANGDWTTPDWLDDPLWVVGLCHLMRLWANTGPETGAGNVYRLIEKHIADAVANAPAADFIPRAEHERLVEEARREATPQDSEQEPVEDWENRLESLILQVEVAAKNLDNWREDSAVPYSFYQHDLAKTRRALRNFVLTNRRPAPLTEQAKLAAGDCVDYLIKEYRMDLPAGERVYSREYEGQKFTVTVSRAYDNIAPARAVAPKGVVEELKRLAEAFDVSPYKVLAYISHDQVLLLKNLISRVTELPEPSDACQSKADNDAFVDIYSLHMTSAYHNRYLALLAAANPAKEESAND